VRKKLKKGRDAIMKKGWIVTFSGMGLNLALGVLYAWSVFGKQFTETVDKGGFGWSKTQAALPYTIAIAFFAAMMVPAGRLQDKFGPRVVATIGAILTGVGLIVSGFASATNMAPVIIGFGVLAGTGIGLGYASATPAAVKWFPPERKGLITGIVVSGFGLASVYIAPLSKYLLGAYGVNTSFIILGIAFAVLTGIVCQFIENPATPVVSASAKNAANNYKVDYTWREMMRTPTFYLLWIEYVCGAMAGLMVIGHLAKIVSVQSNNVIQTGFMFVALLAIFNAGGRLIAGVASDYIGRMKTILLVFISQAIVMLFFAKISSFTGFIIGSAVVGFSYGSCLSLFPSTTADHWGTKNLGLNYGIMFTAWGVGGVFGPILAGKVADASGNYSMAYTICAALLIFAAILTFFTKAPAKKLVEEPSLQAVPAAK
jgi:OFA family oxalate/formate antiporter-like MFS transporter